MKVPRLTVVKRRDDPKYQLYQEHLKLCGQCREALTEIDLCLEGLDLWLDKEGIKALCEKFKP